MSISLFLVEEISVYKQDIVLVRTNWTRPNSDNLSE